MLEPARPQECSYFLVRYVPDLVRDETLNIGLFLYSPREKYLGCLFTDDFRRVKRFHPQADVEFLRELQQDFEQQIDERGEDLERFIGHMRESFSNLIQLSPPRTCYLSDPQTEIQDLFTRYVGPRVSGPPPQDTRLGIKQRLTAALVRAEVWEKLEKRVPAHQWTKPGDPFAFDYAYKPLQAQGKPNGHIQLIHALSLKRDTQLAIVLKETLGRVREKEPAHLTAVVEGLPRRDDETARFSESLLQEAEIRIQPLEGVEEYAASVRRELMM